MQVRWLPCSRFTRSLVAYKMSGSKSSINGDHQLFDTHYSSHVCRMLDSSRGNFSSSNSVERGVSDKKVAAHAASVVISTRERHASGLTDWCYQLVMDSSGLSVAAMQT